MVELDMSFHDFCKINLIAEQIRGLANDIEFKWAKIESLVSDAERITSSYDEPITDQCLDALRDAIADGNSKTAFYNATSLVEATEQGISDLAGLLKQAFALD